MTLARVVIVLVFCLALGACKKEDAGVATLLSAVGKVDRDHAKAVGSWESGATGAVFHFGDGVRTAAASRASLRLTEGSELSMDPKTLIRFLAQRPGKGTQRFNVEMGEATLKVGAQPLGIETELGEARIEPGSRVRLVRSGARSRFEVEIGAAKLLGENETFELRVGDAVEIEGQGAVTRVPAAVPAPSASAAASVDPATAPAPAASVEVPGAAGRSRGPAVVDLRAAAGDSFTVHDPKPPTAIGFLAQGKCGAGVLATLDPGSRAREIVGESQVNVEIPAGSHRYTIACLGDERRVVAEGVIAVLRDSGSRRLPVGSASTTVDTDGRSYTVLYQNRLPKIAVRWPGAPVSGPFELTVQSPSGAKTVPVQEARYAFPVGAFGEGQHRLSFAGGGQRSKATTLTIRFDNAAPTASLTSPADGSFAPGASVDVAGTALPGFVVAVGGNELSQDGQSRFSGSVTAPAGDRALAIRFTQPGRGTHYYLRRSAR